MNNNARNLMPAKAHGITLVIGDAKTDRRTPTDEEQGEESAGYSETGPAVCGKCSHFAAERCDEEHMANDPEAEKDDKGAIVNGKMGWCHYFDPTGPQGKDKEAMMQEESGEPEEKEHNYPARFNNA